MEGDAAPRHRRDDRAVDAVDDLLDLGRVEARHRRVAAHAAGVRPLVAVEDPLVVLGRRQRHDVLAVAERQQRELLALEELLQHHRRLAEASLGEEDVERRRAPRPRSAQMITPLPAASPSALSTVG